ncbi:hypothetical protein GCM10010361_41840 [Streptomyces olivaceiscleroticus]|uniref:Transposase n=1 Tax=Streptomyces olivaceiscleroticus TaxID=68245 RepID=A0ABN1ACQ1_9ACTN
MGRLPAEVAAEAVGTAPAGWTREARATTPATAVAVASHCIRLVLVCGRSGPAKDCTRNNSWEELWRWGLPGIVPHDAPPRNQQVRTKKKT